MASSLQNGRRLNCFNIKTIVAKVKTIKTRERRDIFLSAKNKSSEKFVGKIVPFATATSCDLFC